MATGAGLAGYLAVILVITLLCDFRIGRLIYGYPMNYPAASITNRNV
ncbi:hypothetical protein MASSI9I_60205 [Massilia sp. 9I]|nr:hypothetical protein MASSI9I_60205 [Massilia sp. 9I]